MKKLDLIYNEIDETLRVTRDGLDMEGNVKYTLKSKKLILNGLTLSNKHGVLKLIFSNDDRYNTCINKFCNLIINELKLVAERNLSPLLMDFYECVVFFLFNFNKIHLEPKDVLYMIEKSSFLSYILSMSENLQQNINDKNKSHDNSIIGAITSFFMQPNVWISISKDMFRFAFQSSRILHLLRKIIIRFILYNKKYNATEILSFDQLIEAFNDYFLEQNRLWGSQLQSNGNSNSQSNFVMNGVNPILQTLISFLQILIPIVESEKYVSNERTDSFLLDLLHFLLMDVGDQPPFELKMEAFRLSGTLLKSSSTIERRDAKKCSAITCEILKKRIFRYHFPGPSSVVDAGSSDERENCKAVEVGLLVLNVGGIFCHEYFSILCRKILHPDHLLREKIDQMLKKIITRYAKDPAPDMVVRLRSSIMELSTSILFNNNLKLYGEDLKEMVLKKVCIPYLLHCQKDIISNIFRTGYKSLPGNQPLFDWLLPLSDASKVGNVNSSFIKYSFSLLQILYQRLDDKEIKNQIVELVQGYGTGKSHLGKRFADGKDTALTMHIILQSKKIILHQDPSVDHSCKVAAFLCLCHCAIKTQRKMQTQVNLINSKSKKADNSLMHWKNLIVDVPYPSQDWRNANADCVTTTCSIFEYLWNQNKNPEPNYEYNAWATFDEEQQMWIRVADKPQPEFMKILLDIGTNATETPLCLKIFILHLISEMPEYFKPFSTEWEAFCISTLVDYSADTRLFDDRFQDFFKRMTSILADWHDDHGDVMMKNVANSGRADLSMLSKLKTFFNNWIKVLAYTKGVIKSKALDHFKILFKHWFQEMNSQILSVDTLLIFDIYMVGCNAICNNSHWLFKWMEESNRKSNVRWASQLQALALAIYCIINEFIPWNWEKISSIMDKDTFLYDKVHGIRNKVFEAKYIDIRFNASRFICTIAQESKEDEILGKAFYDVVRMKLQTKFNPHNKAETKKLLQVALHLGPRLCNSRDFFSNFLGRLSLLDSDSVALALEITHKMLTWEEVSVDLVTLCFEHLETAFDMLASQDNQKTKRFLLEIMTLWIEKKPIEEWPKSTFVSIKINKESSTTVITNTNFTMAYITNENPDICILFYELCISMDRRLVAKNRENVVTPVTTTTTSTTTATMLTDDDAKLQYFDKGTLYLRDILLLGLKNRFRVVKDCLLSYWNEILPQKSSVNRALSLLNPNIIREDMEDFHSQLSSYLMLCLVKNGADYRQNSFLPRCNKEIHKCDFTDLKINAGSGNGFDMTQSLYMEPAFSSMVSSMIIPSSTSQSTNMDIDDNWASQSLSTATSNNNSNYGDMVMATQNDGDMLFSLTQSEDGGANSSGASTQLASQNFGIQLYRKRKMDPNNGSFAMPYSRSKRRKYEKESKRKVLYRSYRIGELPDTKLKYKDLIDPLLNLFIFDKKLANMAANSIFLYALKDEGYHSILNILARSNTDNIHKRDFSFIRNCFTLLSGPTKDDISIEQLEIIKNEAISSLNLAAGAVVIEENIIANDRLANDGNDGWECLNSIYETLKEEEIMDGLKQYETDALNQANSDTSSDDESTKLFLKDFFSKVNRREWKGAHGIVWEEIDKLLNRYSSLDVYSFSARHDALSMLPLFISCQDFVTLQENDNAGYDDFDRLVTSWEKSWPSHRYDSVKTWDDLHQTRMACIHTIPESNRKDEARMSCLYRLAEGSFLQNNKMKARNSIVAASKIRKDSQLKKTFKDGYITARYFYLVDDKSIPALNKANSILEDLKISKLLDQESETTKAKFYILQGNIFSKKMNIHLEDFLKQNEDTSKGYNDMIIHDICNNARTAYTQAGGPSGYCALALFDEKLLDNLEKKSNNSNGRSSSSNNSTKENADEVKFHKAQFYDLSTKFIDNLLHAMKLGSIVASERFSKVLSLMAHPDSNMKICSYFSSQAKKYQVEPWKFLSFIPLMMAFFKENHSMRMALKDIIINVAEKYPQAVYYDFRIAKESMNLSDSDTIFVVPLKRIFQKVPNLTQFADAIIEIAQRKAPIDPKYKKMKIIRNKKAIMTNKYADIYKGQKMRIESPYLLTLLHSNIEIPGQYRNTKSMPLPNGHAAIAYVEESMLILSSMRAPKRLTFYGSDSVEYRFLAKSDEDLRNDQRVQQVFEAMNSIFRSKPDCRKHNMKVNTFAVVPITMTAGLIEWVDGTCTLSDTYGPEKKNKEAYVNRDTIAQFIKEHGNKSGSDAYDKIYKDAASTRGEEKIRSKYKETTATFNNLRFRNYLRSIASTAETFVTLRSKIISSRAVINIATYLLGIGDRHLGNCLLRKSDCELIPIDFGHTFGSATFLLPVPELIPFRHSKQMVHLMAPHPNRNAALEAHMCTVMKAMISEKSLLLSSMRSYLADPILEWRQKSSSNLVQSFQSLKLNTQNKTCLQFVERKIAMESPFSILYDTLNSNKRCVPANINYLKNFVKGLEKEYKINNKKNENDNMNNNNNNEDDINKKVKEQIKQLMILATDDRVHYRAWHGLNLWC